MNWIISSLIMFVSSVALYLLIRKSALVKNPSQYNNLAMFLIPFFVFVFMGFITHQNFILPLNQLLITIFAAIFFSYIGNVFSLISIERAPNPGYSLVISKSYVVFTTLVAVLIFHSELTLRKAVAIILIVLFSALIMLSQKAVKKGVDKKWLPLSIGAFFCWGLLSLVSKYLFNQGINIYVFLSYAYLIVSTCVLTEMLKKKFKFNLIKKNPKIFLLIGLLSTGFNLFMFESIKIAPNVGYVNAINASSISAVTIFAALFFKDELTTKKLIGVLGVTAGLLILLI